MELTKKNVIGFLIVGGLFIYLLHASLQAVFIIALPMEEGWAVDSTEVQTGEYTTETYVTEFKNEVERAKYYHNQNMLKRNKWLIGGEFVLSLILTVFIFYWIPKWKQGASYRPQSTLFFSLLFMAFASSFLVPLVLSWILPAPATWFPQVFRDMNDTLVQEELTRIENLFGN